MRIALVIWQLDTYGGSIRQVLELARKLQSTHEVEIFTYRAEAERCFPDLITTLRVNTPPPITVRQQFYNPSSPLPVRIIGFLKNIWVQHRQVDALGQLLAAHHQKKHFDVVNYHDNGVIRIAHRLQNVRQVWMMNDPPSFIDTREKDASPYAQTMVLRALSFGLALWTRWQLRHIDAVTVLDTRNQRIVKKYFNKDAFIVRSGLHIATTNQKFRSKKNHLLQLLTTNIFFRHRRYEDVIEALKLLVERHKFRSFHLNIVGDPLSDQGYYDMIRSKVENYSLEKYVSFLGRVDERTLEKEYRRADVFLFPNHRQTWGLSVFEAMARSCACIVSDTAGAHEVLSDGKNALIVQSKSPTAISDAIEKLSATPYRKKIAKNGYAFVIKHISWQHYATAMMEVFSDVK